jgi:N-alpha-acetyltransferase 38, NatC auxiliary subunit
VLEEAMLLIAIQERNIILAKTYEYRMPTEKAKKEALEHQKTGQGAGRAVMKSRFLGLVVVPGRHIIKLEVEEKKSWELPLRPT